MIPGWLRDQLASPPAAGNGIHAWLFSVARQLHAHWSPDQIFETLTVATVHCERHVTAREIRDAVRNSAAVAWRPKENPQDADGVRPVAISSSARLRRPKINRLEREGRLAQSCEDGVSGLVDLWERSPVRPSDDYTADDWIDILFPSAGWLCLAEDHPATARTRRREKWSFGAADKCGLIVPSPMTAPSGRGLDGELSHRCLDNTGPRRWLVIEFDPKSDWAALTERQRKYFQTEANYEANLLDEQAALHWCLSKRWPLALAVHSAGKSLHGWYGPAMEEREAENLMAYATSLGADTATWNRCQLVRLPGGTRRGKRLEVFYFHPTLCLSNVNYSACGEAQESAQPAMKMAA